MSIESYLILTVTLAMAVTSAGYVVQAKDKGWPIAKGAISHSSVQALSFICGLFVLGESFYLYSWWSPIAVFVVAGPASSSISFNFKEKVQAISLVGTVVGMFFCIRLLGW